MESPIGKYEYGFDDARQACAEKGAVLASLAQLYQDPPDGFWVCRCGWMSDARAGFVMHKARPACHNKEGFYLCTHLKKWNAWCFCPAATGHD
ncbi:tumor necrosis factor-inducible gene 6 protein-like [Branchiostoma lanceolatum]|uniref:tumor necrosis factor-inducible gene 6 protein-like n=1 Tax=Branchiostoma lanceolatum TaxID=7740 RepID=UPI00345209A0